jgi:hypothetical protein
MQDQHVILLALLALFLISIHLMISRRRGCGPYCGCRMCGFDEAFAYESSLLAGDMDQCFTSCVTNGSRPEVIEDGSTEECIEECRATFSNE